MAIPYELIVKQDLSLGHGNVAVTMPAGGSATGAKIGIHTLFGERYFNVKDFGATGNGLADDSPYVQAAIDETLVVHIEENPVSIGGIVYFPPGVYLLRSTIYINNDNTRLIGVGGASILWPAATNGIEIFPGFGSIRGCWLEDMQIQPASGGSNSIAVHIKSANWCGMRRVRVVSAAAAGRALHVEASNAVAIMDCKLDINGSAETVLVTGSDSVNFFGGELTRVSAGNTVLKSGVVTNLNSYGCRGYATA